MNARIPGLNEGAVEEDLKRLLASRAFARAARLRELVRYIVAATLAEETHRLRETSIALDVFHRDPAHYDPTRDGIVRVSANRLRTLLERYYAEEGKEAGWRFELPPGGYIPIIRRRAPHGLPGKPRVSVVALEGPRERIEAAPTQRIVRALIAELDACVGVDVVAAEDDASPADVMLEAGVQRGTSPLVITAQARLVADGSLLWRHTFEQADADHHVLTWRLVDLVTRTFADAGAATPTASTTPSPGVRADYLIDQARHLNATQLPDNLVRADALALQATQQSPQHADAWFVLAMVRFSKLAAWESCGDATHASVQAALGRAATLDARHAPTLSLSAYVTLLATWDWKLALQLARRAVALAPDHAGILGRLAYLTLASDEYAEAHALYLRSVTCDPFAPPARSGVAMSLNALGEHAEALATIDQAERIIGTSSHLTDARVQIQLASGDVDAAQAEARAWQGREPGSVHAAVRLAQARAVRGDVDAARGLLDAIASQTNPVQRPYLRMLVEACGADAGAAIAAAREAVEARSPGCVAIGGDPLLRGLHPHPGWTSVLRAIGRDA